MGTDGRTDLMLDELRNHRADGYATTADLIRILEIIAANGEELAAAIHQAYRDAGWGPVLRGSAT